MEILSSALIVHRQFFNKERQTEICSILATLPYRRAPSFLGSFQYSKYQNPDVLNPVLQYAINELTIQVPQQQFNTIFIQRYPNGSYVKQHRDPFNNIGKTIVAIFGEFSGAESHHDNISYYAYPGDVVIQDCTIDGCQGAYHSVDTIYGERYAVILNTIE